MRNIATFLAVVLGLCTLPLLALWLVSRISYFVGRTGLRINFFGFTVRRIPYVAIKRVSKRVPKVSATYWVNVPKLSHRAVTVYLHKGKPVVLSPINRYVFIGDLKRAVQAAVVKTAEADSTAAMPEFDDAESTGAEKVD